MERLNFAKVIKGLKAGLNLLHIESKTVGFDSCYQICNFAIGYVANAEKWQGFINVSCLISTIVFLSLKKCLDFWISNISPVVTDTCTIILPLLLSNKYMLVLYQLTILH